MTGKQLAAGLGRHAMMVARILKKWPPLGTMVGMWTIQAIYFVQTGASSHRRARADGLCRCGNTRKGVALADIIRGHVWSCGCKKTKKDPLRHVRARFAALKGAGLLGRKHWVRPIEEDEK